MSRDHGTYSSYRGGCRCDDCVAAKARARKRWKETPPREHGTYTMYRHGGCRCDPCREAMTERGRTWTRYSGARRRVGLDPVNVEAFIDGHLDWTETTSEERRAAAWHMDRRGVSRAEIQRRTHLGSQSLYRTYALTEDPMTGYRYDGVNAHAMWEKLNLSRPPSEPECAGKPHLFVDWLTDSPMRGGYPETWAQPFLAAALAMCNRCPLQRWCVEEAVQPHRSKVTIIAGGALWAKGVRRWTIADQERLGGAQARDGAA